MIITAAQLRAARGLLDWTRSELAKASGLSPETIKNIEHGIYTPQEATIKAILDTFAQNDVEFTENEGVRIRKNEVRVFTGKGGYKQFLDFIYAVMRDGGGRIRQFNLTDGNHLPFAGDYAREHIERMMNIQDLDAKVLTIEGDHSQSAPYCEYRWMEKDKEALIPYYVFNDYLVIPIIKPDQNIDIVCIQSKQLADRYVEQFDAFWASSQKIKG